MGGRPAVRWPQVGVCLAAMALAGGAAGSWQLFQRDLPCQGDGPPWLVPALGAVGLGLLGAVAAALSWVAGWWRYSRRARAALWSLAVVAVLCGIGMVLLGRTWPSSWSCE
ncbi:hypothetical protein ACFV4F_16560 [Kitasatospora sp. NPDC059722]|uniref:hypothetical protein n=1 Tax=unclassified Kitasatospora TaxID=2633591 RepID=UPI0036467D20